MLIWLANWSCKCQHLYIINNQLYLLLSFVIQWVQWVLHILALASFSQDASTSVRSHWKIMPGLQRLQWTGLCALMVFKAAFSIKCLPRTSRVISSKFQLPQLRGQLPTFPNFASYLYTFKDIPCNLLQWQQLYLEKVSALTIFIIPSFSNYAAQIANPCLCFSYDSSVACRILKAGRHGK